MTATTRLDDLWNSAAPGLAPFAPGAVAHLPEPARRLLAHAIAPGTVLANAVRLRMHGEIRLRGWYPFRAEQVIRADGQMLWTAALRMAGLPVRGFDRLVAGAAEMRWKALGLVPLVQAQGPDVTRSAAGRVAAEMMWLPSALCAPAVAWSAPDAGHACARLPVAGETSEVCFALAATGRIESLRMRRWGKPAGGAFGYVDFGGQVLDERTFGGYTIASRLAVGWYFGSPRFGPEGEFFRVTLDEAQFR